MGYCMSQKTAKFNMKAESKVPALKAIKAACADVGLGRLGRVKGCRTLEELMEECGWDLQENDDGDVTGIQFSGEKAGDDLKLFNVLAPFVDGDSYIEMHGEDGSLWRWVFDGKTCVEKTPKVSWD
jgi:hypothetical protein